MMLKTLSLAAALALVAAAAPAYAFDHTGTTVSRAKVNYADLDVSRPAGANALLLRIKGAARQVCGAKPSARDLVGHQQFNACMTGTIERAVADVHSPLLSDLFENGPQSMTVAERH